MSVTPPTLPAHFGTPGAAGARRMLLLGSGELGREVVLEAMRLGIEVIACDRYAGAPAMQFAHRSHVFDMLDGAEVRRVVEAERPHYIVPEIEAIATATLVALEAEGWNVVPSSRAASLTLERVGFVGLLPRSWDCRRVRTDSRRRSRNFASVQRRWAFPASSSR